MLDVKGEIIKNIHRSIRNNLGCLGDRTAEETYRLFIHVEIFSLGRIICLPSSPSQSDVAPS